MSDDEGAALMPVRHEIRGIYTIYTYEFTYVVGKNKPKSYLTGRRWQ